MSAIRFRWVAAGGALALTLACGGGHSSSPEASQPSQPSQPSPPQISLTRLSTDEFSNSDSQHETEVEPGMFAFGSTIVAAFQVGRRYNGGASDIGFATSTNGGRSWSNGVLPAITIYEGGNFIAVSDPTVAFDSANGTWIVASLSVAAGTDVVTVSRSSDGINWGAPVSVSSTPDADKPWIVCDNHMASPFFGHCYVQWDDPSANGLIWMSTSLDGGATWSPASNTAGLGTGIGGQPLVRPDGTMVVPLQSADGTTMLSFSSSDGGATWNAPATISGIADHIVAGNLRTIPLPSATIDSAGTVYVVWQDCRFRASCASNDIVLSTSTDAITWSSPIAIPIDSSSSSVDHFLAAITVDPTTGSGAAHLAMIYYFYPNATCSTQDCELNLGYVTSKDGGKTWNSATTLAGPMSSSWLPNTSSGLMVGDYFAVAFSNSQPYGVFAVANAKSGTLFDEAIYTTVNALPQGLRGTPVRSRRQPVLSFRPDHSPRRFYDLEHRYPIRSPLG